MEFIDTHCHIQQATPAKTDQDYVAKKWNDGGFDSPEPLISNAQKLGVRDFVCVGCTLDDSKLAIELATKNQYCVASIGIHPHEAKDHLDEEIQAEFAGLAINENVVAVGECGLDYFYEHSPRAEQIILLEFQLNLAKKHNLPVIFHVRQAFDDFWPIFDKYDGLRGVLHSYTDDKANMEKASSRGLYIGLNGIMSFTKDDFQLEMAKAVPLKKLLLETDAPFLTPKPYRGTICEPKHVVDTAKFLSILRGEPLEELAAATTLNAKELFGL